MMESKVEAVAAAGTALQGAGPSRAPGEGLEDQNSSRGRCRLFLRQGTALPLPLTATAWCLQQESAERQEYGRDHYPSKLMLEG